MTETMIDEFRASTRSWLGGSFGGWATLALCFVGVGFLVIFVRWLSNIGVRYEITDQRIIVHRGIVIKSTDEIELYRVKDIRVSYSIANQITDIGTVILTSTDRTTRGRPFAMFDIPQARQKRDELRNLVEAARRSRGVRELDFDAAF